MLGAVSGDCSDQIVQRLVDLLVSGGIRVVDVASIAEVPGRSVQVSMTVTRCVTEQSSFFRDRVHEPAEAETSRKYEVLGREYHSMTTAHLRADVEVTDTATGEIVGVITSDYAPQLVNESTEAQPGFPAAGEALNVAYALVNQDVVEGFLGWTETRNLLFYDDGECGMGPAYRALILGTPERALELSLEGLEACTSAPNTPMRKVTRAYYNVGMSYAILGEYAESLGYLRNAAALDEGDIVRDAIQMVEGAVRIQGESADLEVQQEVAPARRGATEPGADVAEANLTNEDVITMVQQGFERHHHQENPDVGMQFRYVDRWFAPADQQRCSRAGGVRDVGCPVSQPVTPPQGPSFSSGRPDPGGGDQNRRIRATEWLSGAAAASPAPGGGAIFCSP